MRKIITMAVMLSLAVACADVDADTSVDVTVPLPEQVRCWVTIPKQPGGLAELAVVTDTESASWKVERPVSEKPQLYYYDGFRRVLVTCEVLDGQEE